MNTLLYIVTVWGGVESSLEGPFENEGIRVIRAKEIFGEGEEMSCFRLDLADGVLSISDFINNEIDDNEGDDE